MKKYLIIPILLIAVFLRLYKLGEYPALNADEAAIGYNAYSLIETGKDEHGNPWPIHFQSFNDYKPGLVFYLVIPFVKLFGLTEWAVRIPGALLGAATVYVIYQLVLELFKNKKWLTDAPLLALVASFLLAVSPWHIHFSRGIWEVNIATFFITVGVWLFIRSMKRKRFLVISFIFFIASLYTYHAARVVVPLMIVGFLIIYKKRVFANMTAFVKTGLFSLILLFPLALGLFKGGILSRAVGVGIFADTGTVNRINEQRGEHEFSQGLSAKLFHNKAVNYSLVFLKNWAEHYSGDFLFLSGDEIQRNRVPNMGQMYFFDVLLLIVGGWWMMKNLERKSVKTVLVWLIVAPVASALTFQSPHALRAQNMIIPLTIISALGVVKIIEAVKGKKLLAISMLLAVLVWQFTSYAHMYYVHMAKEYPFSSQYGVKELADFVQENAEGYENVIVTTRYDQPYILFLFYQAYPPKKFQEEHVLTPQDKFGFSTVEAFDKYVFKEITDNEEISTEYPNSLIAGTDEEIHERYKNSIIKTIFGSNGYKYFELIESK